MTDKMGWLMRKVEREEIWSLLVWPHWPRKDATGNWYKALSALPPLYHFIIPQAQPVFLRSMPLSKLDSTVLYQLCLSFQCSENNISFKLICLILMRCLNCFRLHSNTCVLAHMQLHVRHLWATPTQVNNQKYSNGSILWKSKPFILPISVLIGS